MQDKGCSLGQGGFPDKTSLDEKCRVAFRNNCTKCLHFALDRPDIQFTAKEISRVMATIIKASIMCDLCFLMIRKNGVCDESYGLDLFECR